MIFRKSLLETWEQWDQNPHGIRTSRRFTVFVAALALHYGNGVSANMITEVLMSLRRGGWTREQCIDGLVRVFGELPQ